MITGSIEYLVTVFLILLTGFFITWKPHFFSKNIEAGKKGITEWWIFAGLILVLISFLVWKNPSSIEEWTHFYLIVWLSYISVIDFKYQVIPNILLIFGLLAWLSLFYWIGNYTQLLTCVLVLIFGYLLNFVVQRWKGKNGFGWGDIKLSMVLALFLGWDVFPAFYLAVIPAGIFALFGLVIGKLERQSRISFAPFLLAGVLLSDIVKQWEFLGF